MSLEGDLYAAIETAYLADSGAGGLNNTSGDQYVQPQCFVRVDHQDVRDNINWPRVEVDTSSGGEVDSFGVGVVEVYGRFYVAAKRDGSTMFTVLDAVLTRIRTLYHRNQLTASSAWAWSPMTVMRTVKGPTSGTEASRAIEFRVMATRTSGVA